MVGPSDHEPGGHYSEMEIVSVPLGHDATHAFCARLNDDEVAKEIQAHPTVTTMKERRFELRSRDKKWAILSSSERGNILEHHLTEFEVTMCPGIVVHGDRDEILS